MSNFLTTRVSTILRTKAQKDSDRLVQKDAFHQVISNIYKELQSSNFPSSYKISDEGSDNPVWTITITDIEVSIPFEEIRAVVSKKLGNSYQEIIQSIFLAKLEEAALK
ncbi:hypothetical protein [Cohnella terricola]|uniref:Uncharacterized protein n=1 Tax=Cohnella terricola TaxID=1289167 RepID=A0A559JL73_9BACL|nr:hypothetical protein [Cohnella terricola]TVY00619.1 hypothetical protein FPZ45_11445 [Cohnella terricola]